MSRTLNNFAALRSVLMVGAATAATLSVSQPVRAQDTAPAASVEKVVVTGSRIKRSNATSVNPLQVINSAKIDLQAPATVAEIFDELPQVGMTNNLQNTGNALISPAFTGVDLRNLGPEKTLVLVNGRRHVAGSFDNPQVDLGAIPVTLIDRIEVTTGGASAIYGADGVAGVVNVILKRRFDGLVADAQYGQTKYNDGAQKRLSAAYGGNFADRGSASFGVEWATIDEIMSQDRDFARNGLVFLPPLVGPANPQVPALGVRTLVNHNPALDHQFQGSTAVLRAAPFATIIDPSGAPQRVPTQCSTAFPTPAQRRLCTFDQLGAQDTLFTNGTIYTPLQTASERLITYAQAEWDVSDSLTVFSEASWSKVEGSSVGSPSFFSGRSSTAFPPQARSTTGIRIQRDNIFLTPAIQNEMTAAGIPLAGVDAFTTLNMLVEEGGARERSVERGTTRAVVGMKGDFTLLNHPFDFEVYYQYGNSRSDSVSFGQVQFRIREAIDSIADPVNGGIAVCRHELNVPVQFRSCVPYNWVSGPSDRALAYAFPGPVLSSAEIQQQVASAVVNSDFFTLPWAVEPIGMAAGLEWREELTQFTSDASTQNAQSIFNEILPVDDGYDVEEAFVELRVPVASGGTLMHTLAFDAAIRGSTYSNTGYATAWKLGGEWAPTEDIRFRGTLATSQRSPNGFELFSQAANFAGLLDPCDSLNVNAGPAPATRLANCQTLLAGIAGGYNPATFASNLRAATGRLIQTGNRDLLQEEADTVTFGAVVTPRWIDNLVITADYYFIELNNGIATLAGQTVLNGCVDQVGFNTFFCNFIDRNAGPGGDGGVNSVGAPFINNSLLTAEGYDINVSYRTEVADVIEWLLGGEEGDLGSLSIDLAGSHTLESSTKPSPTTPTQDTAGYLQDPYWRGNGSIVYTIGDIQVGWQTQYIHSLRLDINNSPATRQPYFVDSWTSHDVQLLWHATESMSGRIGVNNLFDAEPPPVPTINTAVGLSGSAYDNRGQFIYLGFGVRY